MSPSAPTSLNADDLLAHVAPDRAQKRAAHDEEQGRRRAEHRQRFPLMAELVDAFRAEGMDPRPVFARNDAGETWGGERDVGGIAIDGDKLAHLPEYEAAWRRILGKQPDNRQTYNQRAQRAIKPNAWRVDE